MKRVDVAVIGAGMAGAGMAAELAPHCSVLILEAEAQPGYHSTGRSAAFWSESYGGPLVQPLTSASRPFLSDGGFLKPRGAIHVADAEGDEALRALADEFGGVLELRPLDRRALASTISGLREGWDRGLAEPSCADIDVGGLHAAYLKAARQAGAQLITDARVKEIEHRGGRWRIATSNGEVEAATIVNAAGAWADEVATLAGARPLGIRPYRRTMVQLRVAPEVPPDLPVVIDALGRFYFKPESGRLWLSPHDEIPCEASDCAPEELDIAVAIDRLQGVVDWQVERVEHSWAGLRSFAPDRVPVYGFAPEAADFFWCAGQGGFGIQTAPAASKLAAALLLERDPDPAVAHIDPAPYAPGRFTN
ncbi:MAG TPA: FAD-dependent oxidoreductase [Allosphingosinicella sp.]|uniref:NAD(P)/FAD-dependent oxidoreductase n=1 Tax=Allosphingosinicella sp. TaxID=2823234 RepID=UPI002EDB4CE9